MRPTPNIPKFICDCIVDKTCTQTSNCCPHRIPHAIEENMTCTKLSHECRFAGEGEAVCIPVPPTENPVETVAELHAALKTAPSQRPVEYVNTPPEPVVYVPPEETVVYVPPEETVVSAPPAFDIPEAVEEALSIPQSPATPVPVQPKTEHKTDRRYRGAKRLAE